MIKLKSDVEDPLRMTNVPKYIADLRHYEHRNHGPDSIDPFLSTGNFVLVAGNGRINNGQMGLS
jgi:hypothetical protein